MYHDLKQHYWWSGIKQDTSDFGLKCLVVSNFIPVRSGFSLEKLAKFYITEIVRLYGVDLIKDTEQESYADLKRKDIELEIDAKVFHVSMFRRYRSDPSHVIAPSEIEIRSNMTYEEKPICILAVK
ncbi:Transposon Ty3-I Gag-Pol polyprotein [Gossypium australe]|uniref:Transposon Ty3-I Gag-Pol polyprotein n=1 Tax=Gossypium australe TaxID=47621 RepID=A0A5B6VWK5_9ROSI|nr:Transposon Ty3-I Gag-Pol polyprotein [Gossypium australe]